MAVQIEFQNITETSKLNTTINHWFRYNLKEMSLNVSHATKIKLCLQQPHKTETSELSEDIKEITMK